MNDFEETLKAIRKAKLKAKDPKKARELLIKAGIVDTNGHLTRQYHLVDEEADHGER